MDKLETDPAKILEANMAKQEKAWEFDNLLRDNSVVQIMGKQIINLQQDRDRLFHRVQRLERTLMDLAERKITEAENLTYGTPLDDAGGPAQGGH